MNWILKMLVDSERSNPAKLDKLCAHAEIPRVQVICSQLTWVNKI